MATKTFKNNDRVALAENPSVRGYVHSVVASYDMMNIPGCNLYQVQWDKSVYALYLPEALITEAEAIAAQAKTPEAKSITQAVIEKFGKIFGSKNNNAAQ
jgi:hypothetical protein